MHYLRPLSNKFNPSKTKAESKDKAILLWSFLWYELMCSIKKRTHGILRVL